MAVCIAARSSCRSGQPSRWAQVSNRIGSAPTRRIAAASLVAAGMDSRSNRSATAGISLCSCRTTADQRDPAMAASTSGEAAWPASVWPPGSIATTSTARPPDRARSANVAGRSFTDV